MIAQRLLKSFIMKHYILSLLATGICISFTADLTFADDLPIFRKGMWEFNRTIESAPGSQGKPQTITNKKCANPSEDMKKQSEMLSKSGCKFSSVVKSGNTYSFTSKCDIQGVATQGKSIITVENDGAYTVKVETRHGKQVTTEVLNARRIGNCQNSKVAVKNYLLAMYQIDPKLFYHHPYFIAFNSL
mgnify:FL=1